MVPEEIPVLYHIVLFQPLPDSPDADWDRLRSAILALPDRINGIVSVSWGPNGSPEGIGRGYERGFVMTFRDAAARDAYLPHPDHLAVIPLIEAIAASTLVFDLPV